MVRVLHIALAGILVLTALPIIGPVDAHAGEPQLRRYPYLTDVVGPYATINWATDSAVQVSSVTYGRLGAEPCTAHSVSGTYRTIVVNGVTLHQWKAQLVLQPGAQYCYRVSAGSTGEIDLLGSDPSPRFWTQVPAGSSEPFSFAVIGDWGQVDSTGANPDQANLLAQLAQAEPRFVLHAGDLGHPHTHQTNYGDLIQKGANMSAVFGPDFWAAPGASIPIFPVLGNHDMRADTNHPFLTNWPQDRAVEMSQGRYDRYRYCCMNDTLSRQYPSAWYAFDAGDARFYMLQAAWPDGNVGTASSYQNDYDYHWRPTSEQYQWLERDLAANPGKLKFAVFHFPMYSDQNNKPSDVFLQGDASLEGLLGRHAVNITFTGHAHVYQRNHPNSYGMVSYVTGGGGADTLTIGAKGCSPIDAYGRGWSNSKSRGSKCGDGPVPTTRDQVFHFLLVTVNGRSVTVTPIDSMGRRFDEVTYAFESEDNEPPSVPTGLTAVALDSERVELSWQPATDNVGVTGYELVRDDASLVSLAQSQTSYIDTGLTAGTTYRYQVRAVDAAGNRSEMSAAVSASTPLPPPVGVLFSDDFELGDLGRWTGVTGLLVEQHHVFGGNFATRGTSTGNPTWAFHQLAQPVDELYHRFRFQIVSRGSNSVYLSRLRSATGSHQLGLYVSQTGRLSYRNSVTSVNNISSTTVSNDVWHDVQVRVRVAGDSIEIEVWFNGVRISELSRVEPFGTVLPGRFQLGDDSTGRIYDVVFDDLVVSGSFIE
jgi:hypothetical protein